jgi:hypothetical protein
MRSIRSTPTGRRPLPGLGTEWLDQRAQRQPRHTHLGKKDARRFVLASRSNPAVASVNFFIPTTHAHQSTPPHIIYDHRSRLLQRHLSQSAECGENEKGVFLFVISCLSDR